MKRLLVCTLLVFWFNLPIVEAYRPEQDEIASDIFSEMSQEEYYDFVVRNIVSGGVGRDDIPPINSPVFISAAEARFLEKKDTVFGTVIEDQSYAFPKKILYWHEVVNMVMYDRETESLILQILETGVDGDLRGLKLDNFPVVVTTWDLWRKSNPQTRDYGWISYNASLKILEIGEVSVEPTGDEGEVMPIHNFEVYWFAWYAYFPTTIVLE